MNKAKLEAWLIIAVGFTSSLYLTTYVEMLSYWQATLPFVTAGMTIALGAEKLIAANKSSKQP